MSAKPDPAREQGRGQKRALVVLAVAAVLAAA